MSIRDTSAEILVVDDSESFARVCASSIEKACNLRTLYATTPQAAESLLKDNRIKVIIFDQKMPIMTGTELYKRLRKIDPYFKSMLLSNEASPEEFTYALQLGFNELLVKDKHLLHLKILDLVSEYHRAMISSNLSDFFYSAKIGGIFSREIIQYSVVSVQIIDSEHIADDSWVVSDEIRAGESKEISVKEELSITSHLSESLEEAFNVDWVSKIGLPASDIAKFSVAFSNEVKKMVSSDKTQSIKINKKSTWSRSLPADGDIAYERLELAPIYQKARIFIKTSFSWSSKTYLDFVEQCLPTSAIKGRIFRCFKDGNNETLDLQTYRLYE